jgi:hypothetical protein
MNRPIATTASPDWVCETGMTYTVTADDLSDGRNKLGIKVNVPLDTPLCEGCDQPVPADGLCHDCCIIHLDVSPLGENWFGVGV